MQRPWGTQVQGKPFGDAELWNGWDLEGERLLQVWTQLTGEGLRNLAVEGAGSGELELVPEQGQVSLIWVFGSFVHSCLDSMGWHTFLDSPFCASSGLSPAQVPVPAWRWTRGKGTCVAI